MVGMIRSRPWCVSALAGVLALAVGVAWASDEPAKTEAPAEEAAADGKKADQSNPAATGDEAEKADQPHESGASKPAGIRPVLRDLIGQGREAMKNDLAWPHVDSAYAQVDQIALKSEDVIDALGRRHGGHPLVDAYVKHQLLSFNPRLGEIEGHDAGRVIAAMPKYIPDAQPAGHDLGFLAGYAKGRPASADARQRAQQIFQQMQQQQLEVDRANLPAERYREALIDRLPDEGGIRLMARVQELEDRMRAGQSKKDVKQALSDLLSDTASLRTDPKLPMAVRRAVGRKLMRLGTIKTQVLENVAVTGNSQLHARFSKIEIGKKEMGEMLANLAGKEPVDPKKK